MTSFIPEITTRRLAIRPYMPPDAAQMQRMTDTPVITNAISFLRAPFTLLEAQALIARNASGHDCFCGVWRLAEHDLIGTIGTHRDGRGGVEIGYWFAPDVHGQGYAHEAAAAVIDVLRARYRDETIYAECRPDNAPSLRLLKRLGFAPTERDGAREGRKLFVLRLDAHGRDGA